MFWTIVCYLNTTVLLESTWRPLLSIKQRIRSSNDGRSWLIIVIICHFDFRIVAVLLKVLVNYSFCIGRWIMDDDFPYHDNWWILACKFLYASSISLECNKHACNRCELGLCWMVRKHGFWVGFIHFENQGSVKFWIGLFTTVTVYNKQTLKLEKYTMVYMTVIYHSN